MGYKVGDAVKFNLANGRTLTGTILSRDGNYYWVKTGDGTYCAHMWDVELIAPTLPYSDTHTPYPLEPEAEETEYDKLRRFFFPTPEVPEWGKHWKSEGKCPRCGELGRIHLSTFICSIHGVY